MKFTLTIDLNPLHRSIPLNYRDVVVALVQAAGNIDTGASVDLDCHSVYLDGKFIGQWSVDHDN